MKPIDDPERYSDEEIARRRDDVIRRMLDTPPQPRAPKTKERPALKGRARKGKGRARKGKARQQ
jgi:hypothetical protein